MPLPASPPAISVVMPVRDARETLADAVDSILGQTERDWELVAVDDGSTDGSLDVLRGYARRDPRVRTVPGGRRGLVHALNAGLAAARGALIARMDADDVSLPERLTRQRAYLDGHPDVGLVASRALFAGDARRGAGYARYVDWTNRLLTPEAIALARFVESPLAHPSVMFRRDLPARLGSYREGPFPEDYELWLRWLEGGVRMAKLAEPLLVWRDSAARLSRRDARYASEAFYRLKAPYLARWLAAHNAHHPRVILWGAGRLSRRRGRWLAAEGVDIASYIDIDPRKIGRVIEGRPVAGPATLPPPGETFIVAGVASVNAREQIECRLQRSGHRPGRDYVLAA